MSAHKFTAGPWVVRATPESSYGDFAVQIGKDYVNLHNEGDAKLIAAAPKLLEALQELLDDYTGLVNSGDCGNWNPEEDPGVIKARAAIREATA